MQPACHLRIEFPEALWKAGKRHICATVSQPSPLSPCCTRRNRCESRRFWRAYPAWRLILSSPAAIGMESGAAS